MKEEKGQYVRSTAEDLRLYLRTGGCLDRDASAAIEYGEQSAVRYIASIRRQNDIQNGFAEDDKK